MNILGLGDPVGFEDIEEGRRSQRKLATLRFNAAVFRPTDPFGRVGTHPQQVGTLNAE
jgi:hypothetical protein